ncbi:MAG TPA: vWA domain-containing protein [Steroidobacteraceae bacterium]
MRRARRDIETFSLSFLDCICCGFGAIILLLVLVEIGEPVVIERDREDLQGTVLRLQEELHALRGETTVLNRELRGRIEQLSSERSKLARLQGDLTSIHGEYAASRGDSAVANVMETELVAAYQKLTEEMERLMKTSYRRPKSDTVGGIPVDSEYIIFVVDTSGSMQEYNWRAARQMLSEILDMYPRVKGIQIMDDEGAYMFDGYRGQWIADTPARRKAILDRFTNWTSFSNSSPVEGILAAIRSFWSADKKISIYLFGDDYTGESIQAALDAVDRANRVAGGERRVRIHAIGFAMPSRVPQFGNQRFSALMRAMCERNGGTFVGLHEQGKT